MPAEPQLPASILVPALIRQVQAAGGFATLLSRGGPYGNTILLVWRQAFVRAYEKLPDASGGSVWRMAAEGEDNVESFIVRQRRFDPDIWVLELDVADPARFIPGFVARD